jgi:hypothetical protein
MAVKHPMSTEYTIGEGFLTCPNFVLTYNHLSLIQVLQFIFHNVDLVNTQIGSRLGSDNMA